MRYWIVLVVYIFTPPAFAEKKYATAQINLEEVIANVLQHNPQILAGDIEARAAVSRIRQAQQSSSPLTLKLDLENFAGSGEFDGDDQLETTLSFAKVLETGRKAELRGRVASYEANLLRDEQDARKLDVLAEATKRFIHVVLDQHKLAVARNKVALVKETEAIVARRARLGRSPESESRRVRIAQARAKIELEHAEHELKASQLRLSASWGDLDPSFGSAQAELYDLAEPVAFEYLVTLLERNPDLAQYATRERLAAARLSLANSRSSNDIEISGGVRHFNINSDTALILSASIPLGTSSRSQAYKEEAQLLSQLTPHKLEQRRVQLHTTLYGLTQEIKHAYEAVMILRETIIPEAKLVLRDYQRGYEAGRYSLIELNTVQRSLLDAQLEAAVSASNYHNNKIEIERLTGKYLARSEEK